MKKITLILISLFLLSISANAQWEDIGGVCTEDNMKSVFQENDTIYAISDTEMYRSFDFGENWVKYRYAITSGHFTKVLQFAHQDSAFVVFAVNGVFISYDYGNTWSLYDVEIPANFNLLPIDPYFVSFHFDGNDIYAAATNHGIYRLAENDTIFRQLGCFNLLNINDFYAKDSLIICLSSELHISNDYGATWTAYPTNLQHYSSCFFEHQSDIYYYNSEGLFKSSDQGVNWTDISYLLPTTNNLKSFLVRDNTWFLGITDSILMQSNDFGVTWYLANMGLPLPLSSSRIKDIYKDGRTVYFAYSSDGIYKSTDGGFNWKHKSNGMKEANCYIMETIENTVFAYYRRFESCGLYRSIDHGLNWESINNPEISEVSDIVSESDKLYISDQEGILVSYDRGDSWQRILNQEYIFTLDVEGSTIIAAIHSASERYIISHDSGATWSNSTQNFPINEFFFKIKIIGNSVLINSHKLQYSNDQGNSFTNIAVGLNLNSFEFDYDGTNIVVTTSDNVYFSDNHGASWDTITPSNATPTTYFGHVKIVEDSIIISNRTDTLLYSEIGVFNWQKYTNGLTKLPYYCLVESDLYLYLSADKGMFRRYLNRPPSIVIPPEVEVFIYPNPSNDIFQVRIDDNSLIDQEVNQITIYNMQFQEIKTTYPAKKLSDISINCSGLRPGMYIVSINAGGKVYSQRFIKN